MLQNQVLRRAIAYCVLSAYPALIFAPLGANARTVAPITKLVNLTPATLVPLTERSATDINRTASPANPRGLLAAAVGGKNKKPAKANTAANTGAASALERLNDMIQQRQQNHPSASTACQRRWWRPNRCQAFAYDAQSRLVRQTNPDDSILSYAFDALGNLIQRSISGNGVNPATATYAYDSLGRMLSASGNDGDHPLRLPSRGQADRTSAAERHCWHVNHLAVKTTPIQAANYHFR